ncbi:MAG: YbaY family lipoprotein [Chloroflexota bacterium]|nr:YbaY family lipoprotein [Chloroflexota bacterium]
MTKKFVALVFVILSTALLSALACQDDSGTSNSSTTVTSGKRPNASVSGSVTYRERLALTPGARLEVQLRDTSYQDAASRLIAEQVIENPGQVPIGFKLGYNRDDVDDRNTYSLQARITEADGRLAFINDTAYDVITRGNPRKVDMLLAMVQPPPSEDGGEAVDPNAWVEAPYPIVGAEMLPPNEGHFLRIFYRQSNLDNCSRRRDKSADIKGNDVVVSLTHYVPPPAPWAVPCDEETVELDEIIDLNGRLSQGETYRVIVNGEEVLTFVAQ